MNQAFGRHFLEDFLVGAVIVLVGILILTEAERYDTERINSEELAVAAQR